MAQRLVRTTRFLSSTPTAGLVPLEQRQVCLASEISGVDEVFYIDHGTLMRYTQIHLKGTSSSRTMQCRERFEDVVAQWQGIGAVDQGARREE